MFWCNDEPAEKSLEINDPRCGFAIMQTRVIRDKYHAHSRSIRDPRCIDRAFFPWDEKPQNHLSVRGRRGRSREGKRKKGQPKMDEIHRSVRYVYDARFFFRLIQSATALERFIIIKL